MNAPGDRQEESFEGTQRARQPSPTRWKTEMVYWAKHDDSNEARAIIKCQFECLLYFPHKILFEMASPLSSTSPSFGILFLIQRFLAMTFMKNLIDVMPSKQKTGAYTKLFRKTYIWRHKNFEPFSRYVYMPINASLHPHNSLKMNPER